MLVLLVTHVSAVRAVWNPSRCHVSHECWSLVSCAALGLAFAVLTHTAMQFLYQYVIASISFDTLPCICKHSMCLWFRLFLFPLLCLCVLKSGLCLNSVLSDSLQLLANRSNLYFASGSFLCDGKWQNPAKKM